MSKEKAVAMSQEERDRTIVRTSYIGIGANVLLAGFKAAVGLISNSIAVVLDAVNNLSDALSSVVTIIGNKLAGKRPDKKHPLGYGRIEYLSALIVAVIVLYAGVTSLVESVKKIINPEIPDYSTVSLIIIGTAVAVKIILGRYVKRKGIETGSGALEASGSDAMMDAVLSLSVLISAVIYLTTGFSLEAYVGVIISIMIIKAGIEMVMDTIGEILGMRAEKDLSVRIKELIASEPEVMGAYDLILNNYGPGKNYASVHVELPDTMGVEEVDRLTRRLESKVYRETGIILTGVGVYSYNTKDGEAAEMRNRVIEKVIAHDFVLQIHGFYADTEAKKARFDAVLSFDISPKDALEILYHEMGELYPDYTFEIVADVDVSD